MPQRRPGRGPAREEALLAAAWELGGGGELAAAASAVARLDEALRGRAGMLGHLALQAASDLAWATGTRVTVDRLALHGAMRAARTEDDAGRGGLCALGLSAAGGAWAGGDGGGAVGVCRAAGGG